jgi:hypothetical protein
MEHLIAEHRERVAACEHMLSLVQLRPDEVQYRIWIVRTRARLLDHFAGLCLNERLPLKRFSRSELTKGSRDRTF